MSIDIKKFGATPFQKLDKPETNKQKTPHVRRYFTDIVENILLVLLPIAALLAPLWIFNFAGSIGAFRTFIWLAISGISILLLVILLILLRQKIVLHHRSLLVLLCLLAISLIIGAFTSDYTSNSFGLNALSANPSVFVFIVGILWVGILLFFKLETKFLKSIIISHFIGSTLLAIYIIYSMFFNGGYQNLVWVVNQSWLIVFVITIFAMMSFAMFQKKLAKIIWSISIVLHIFLLFMWDYSHLWIILLFGISALLLFQIIYSKKLWQRNFVYPFQLWAICFLLLIIPVKMFSGITPPKQMLSQSKEVVSVVKETGVMNRIFGIGVGVFPIMISQNEISFFSIDDQNSSKSVLESQPASGQPLAGIVNLYVELGIVGFLIFLITMLVFAYKGVNFLHANKKEILEQSMPEVVYLGTISFLSCILIFISLFFSAWSFSIMWLMFLFIALSISFWACSEKLINQSKAAMPLAREKAILQGKENTTSIEYEFNKRNVLTPIFRVFTGIFVILFIVFAVYGIRIISAGILAQKAYASNVPFEAVRYWKKASERNPWNDIYKVRYSQSNVEKIILGSNISEQKEVIEETTKILFKISKLSNDSIVHWISAKVYTSLESFAEGSTVLARESYLKAINLWPKNLVLPIELAQFYRDHVDTLVSKDVSAAILRLEAQENLRRALILEPNYLPARLELALILEEESGTTAAIAELEPWEDQSPEIMYHVGRLYFNDANFELAAQKFSSVVRQVPSHSNAHYSLGIAYFRLEQFEDSLIEFEEVLKLNPENEDIQEKINQVKGKLGE